MENPKKDDFCDLNISAESDSDESYHSFTEELQNVSLDQCLVNESSSNSPKLVTENKHEHSRNVQETPVNNLSSSDLSPPKCDSSDVDSVPCTQETGHVRSSSPTRNKIHSEENPPGDNSPANLDDDTRDDVGPDGVVNCPADDEHHDDDEEFDICCLVSVKARDDQLELKLKDKQVDISVEDMKAALEEALEQKRAGNAVFAASRYRDAVLLYNSGLTSCPVGAPQDRAVLYHNRGVAYAKMGEHKLAVHSLTQALAHDPRYEKALARRAAEHEASEDLDDALQDYKSLLQLQPHNREAREALVRLPPKIEERNEKLKTEMMGKLKDLGNMILRPFGMSTDNFQLQQDPKSGGYNIQFKQNP